MANNGLSCLVAEQKCPLLYDARKRKSFRINAGGRTHQTSRSQTYAGFSRELIQPALQAVGCSDAIQSGTGVEPDFYIETPPAPAPRDPDSFDLFGDEPTEPPESIPSPAEGEEAGPAGGVLWSGDPSRIVFGQATA